MTSSNDEKKNVDFFVVPGGVPPQEEVNRLFDKSKAPPVDMWESALASIPVSSPPVVEAQAEASGDDSLGSSSFSIPLGSKISRYPIERFRGVKGFNRRISCLTTDRWFAVKTHYEADLGLFYCFNGICCEYTDPSVRYLAPIVVYDTDKDGNIVSAKFTVEYLSLAETAYDALLLLHRSYPLDTIDMLVVCTDEHYQKLGFQPAGAARWRSHPPFQKAVLEKYQHLAKHIIKSFARKLGASSIECETVYRRDKLGEEPQTSGSVVNFDLTKLVR